MRDSTPSRCSKYCHFHCTSRWFPDFLNFFCKNEKYMSPIPKYHKKAKRRVFNFFDRFRVPARQWHHAPAPALLSTTFLLGLPVLVDLVWKFIKLKVKWPLFAQKRENLKRIGGGRDFSMRWLCYSSLLAEDFLRSIYPETSYEFNGRKIESNAHGIGLLRAVLGCRCSSSPELHSYFLFFFWPLGADMGVGKLKIEL